MSTTSETYSDRRRRTRFNLQQGAYAAISPHYIRLGPIANISLGGLGFHYFIDRDQENDIKGWHLTLRNKKHSINEIPFDIVSDYEVTCEDAYYLKMMYCGLKFGPLTFDQFKHLDDFIIYNTIDIISDRRSLIKRRSQKVRRIFPIPSEVYFRNSGQEDRRTIFDRRNYSLTKPFS